MTGESIRFCFYGLEQHFCTDMENLSKMVYEQIFRVSKFCAPSGVITFCLRKVGWEVLCDKDCKEKAMVDP